MKNFPGPGHTNQEFALAFGQGDEKALAFFYHEFYPALCLYANRWTKNQLSAEEIASDAFVKTWRNHYKLHNYFTIRAYLYKTVRRDSQNYLRKPYRITGLKEDELNCHEAVDTPFDHLVRTEVYRIIHTALRKISPATRKVIIMHYLEGKTSGQIAAELNLHPSTVKTQKMEGLKTLRKKLAYSQFLFLYIFSSIFFLFS